jgi:hypothetical protein
MGTSSRKRPDFRKPDRPLDLDEMTNAATSTVTILDRVTAPTVLAEIERRNREGVVPDGYKSSSRLGAVSGSKVDHERGCPAGDPVPGQCACDAGFRDTVGHPTEDVALRLIEGGYPADTIDQAAKRFRNAIDQCWNYAIEAEAAWDLINRVTDMHRWRPSTLGTCQACQRNDVGKNTRDPDDRIRAGYCPACFRAWCRTADETGVRMDRPAFEASRRPSLELRVVPDPPEDGGTGDPVFDAIDGLQDRGILPSPRERA